MNTTPFEQLFNNYGMEDKEKVMLFVEDGDIEGLKTWMKGKIDDEIGGRSMRELRQIAAQLFIKNYSLMGKGELISAIVLNDNKNGAII